jgi:hypothetical protein
MKKDKIDRAVKYLVFAVALTAMTLGTCANYDARTYDYKNRNVSHEPKLGKLEKYTFQDSPMSIDSSYLDGTTYVYGKYFPKK